MTVPKRHRGKEHGAKTHLNPQGNGLQLSPHLIELLDISPCADEVLGLDLTSADLAVLCALLDVGHELLLLVLQLDALAIEFSLRLLERSLVFP